MKELSVIELISINGGNQDTDDRSLWYYFAMGLRKLKEEIDGNHDKIDDDDNTGIEGTSPHGVQPVTY